MNEPNNDTFKKVDQRSNIEIPKNLLQLICALDGAQLTPTEFDGIYEIDQIVSCIPESAVEQMIMRRLIEYLDPVKCIYVLSDKGRALAKENQCS